MFEQNTTPEQAAELWAYSLRGGGWDRLSPKALEALEGARIPEDAFAAATAYSFGQALARKVELDAWAWAALGYAVAPIRATYADPKGRILPNDGKRCQVRFSRGCHLPTNTKSSLTPCKGLNTVGVEYGSGTTGLAIIAQHSVAPLALVDIDDATFPQSRALIHALDNLEYMDIVTGANRQHIYLRDTLPGKLAEIMQVKNEIGAEAFSLRRGNSYLVAPGSYRTGKGKEHWWYNPIPSRILHVSELGEAPQEIYEIPRRQRKAARRTRGVDLEAFVREHKLDAVESPWDGGKRYKVPCPWAETHTNGDPEAAIGMGADGAVWFKCMHGHCEDKGWEEYRAAIDPSYNAKTTVMFERGDGAELAAYLLDEVLPGAVYDRNLERWFVPEDIGYTPLPQGVRRDEALTPYISQLARGETYVEGDKGAKRLRYSQTLVKDVAACARADALGELDKRPIVAFSNGGYELVGGELVLLQEVAPVSFVRPYPLQRIQAGEPFDTRYRFGRFLAEAFESNPEDAYVLLAQVGLCLLGLGTALQQLVFVEGPGKTGKGVMLESIRPLFAPWQVTAITPSRLGDKFGLVGLDRSLINLVADFGSKETIGECGTLKSVVAGDFVEYERKNVDIESVVALAGWLIFGNGFPRVLGAEGAFWRRITILRMRRIVAEAKRNVRLGEYMRSPKEQEYIAAVCIAEALDAYSRGYLLPEPERLIRLEDWRREDVVLRWAADCLEAADTATSTNALYSSFRTWCDAEGIPASFIPRRLSFVQRLSEDYLSSANGAGFLCRMRGLQ